MNPPTIVRLLGFPEQIRLTPRGSAEETSGVVIVTDRDAQVEVALRLSSPSLTFRNGATEMYTVEHVEAGTQHELLLDWSLSGNTLAPYVMIEIDVRYADEHHANTATAIVGIEQRERSIGTAIAIGSALVAAALGLAALARPRIEVREFTVEAPEEQPTRSRSGTGGGSKGATKGRAESPASRSASKSSSKKSSAKKASSSKSSGGGTRRGSGASQSGQRTGGRGSSSARKSAPRRTTRKSR
jgi:hypothetical protein